MPELNVTWPGAVPVEAFWGQQNSRTSGKEVVFDAAAMANSQFDIRPSFSHTTVSVYEGAVPYISADEMDAVLDGYAEIADEIVVQKVKRSKKVVD